MITQPKITKREEVARAIMTPYYDIIYDCIMRGVKDYFDSQASNIHRYRKTTRASLIHDNIVDRIKKAFYDHPKVRFKNSNKMFTAVFDDKCYVKFKKLNDRLRSSNIETNQVKEYRSQLFQQAESFGLVYNLEAGYQWNSSETDIKSVYIVCPVQNGKFNEFIIQLDGHSEQYTLFKSDADLQRAHRKFRIKGDINGSANQEKSGT